MEKEKVIEELMELDRLFCEKLKKEGPSAWSSPYGEDAILVTKQNEPNIIGIENVKKFSNEYIHAVTFNETFENFFEPLSADVSEDLTLGYTTGNYTMKNKRGGKIVNAKGKYVLVWKKYDGKWKVSLQITK